VLRIAHLTDIHVQPEGIAARGLIDCLKAVHETADRPDLILNGGDFVMDVFGQNETRAKTLFDLWQRILNEYCKIPIRHCIGNHDVWGWNKERSGCTGNEPKYGKKWVMELYQLGKALL
jgi:3',5'-cyclic-AMP phosphodiesterase